MSNQRKRLGLIVISIILASFSTGWIIRGFSEGGNPVIDGILGAYLTWFNATIGVSSPEYYHETLGNYTAWIESQSGGVTDHGDLTGLSDDDHNQYLFQDGSEELAGNWDTGNYGINASYLEASEFYLNSEDKTDLFEYPDLGVSYIIFQDGSNYAVKNGSTGIISTFSSFKNAIDLAIEDNAKIIFKQGIYEIDIQTGFTISNIQNLTIEGSHATISYTYEANASHPVNQMFMITDSENILIRELTFNMNEQNYNDAVRPSGAGLAWIGRVIGNSKNIGFYNCRFLNAPECGLIIGISHTNKIIDCWFDNIGEHPIYINGGYNVVIERSVFLNYAKWIRGYIKIAGSIGVSIKTSYFEPGKDQKGYLDSLGVGEDPAVVTADGGSEDITLEDLRCIGDINISRQMIRIINASRVYVNRVYGEDWCEITFLNQDYTTEAQVTNSYFKHMTCTYFPMLMSETTFLDPLSYLQNDVDNSKMQNVVIKNLTASHDAVLYMGRGGTIVNNLELDGCQFIGWTYRIIDATASMDSKINNCIFSGGVSSWGIQAGGTRLKIVNNLWIDNNTYGVKTIYLQSGSDVTVTGNTIGESLTASIGLDYLAVIGDNIGYVTENRGTQTCADNEYIAHGLVGPPTFISVSPMNDVYDDVPIVVTVDWSGVGSTNIRIGLYWVNGTAIFDDVILVSWKAEYAP